MEGKATASPAGMKAPTYLAWSIFNAVCCCTPLGIIAVVYSCRTDTANLIGDTTRAKASSSLAKKLNIAALVIGIVFIIVSIVAAVIMHQWAEQYIKTSMEQIKKRY
ncbi:hypothetical protein Q7C36_022802 [Tachysurus vachellii]|uniref:Uncharacterized protein n=1 Tax=Tachysurus vachellii TaxID=175792 RepID=A0AA88IM44_TACVA|nr:interferon-induced transmembrane protein 3-like [Tachysurus vachellii]KAK2816531.1 hypothetical protein Q7C36_022802 [Tachysurus vachellii]